MKFTTTQLLLLAGSAMALPQQETPIASAKRELSKRALTDIDILNFALTLEHLEATFYKEGLQMYDQAAFDAVGAVPRLRFNMEEVARDEANHVALLTAAITAAKGTPVQQCTYDFGLTGVESFLATSSILEGVGVSAYLGAAPSISEAAYLTVAGAILTVEARHNAYIRDNQMAPGPQSPFPAVLDKPLTPQEAFTLAAPFITGCPAGSNLAFTPLPTLTLAKSNPAYLRYGETVVLETEKALSGDVYCVFAATTPLIAKAKVSGTSASCVIPATIAGESFVILSSSDSTTIDDTKTLAGPAILQIQAGYTFPGFPM